MRESLIKSHQQTVFKQLSKQKYPTKSLSALFDQVLLSSGKIFSVELCPNRGLNTETLEELSPAFCSVTWHSPSDAILQEIPNIPALVLSEQLSSHGYDVLLHLVGRHLNTFQARSILDELQRIHVKNIFVLQGEPSTEATDKDDFPYAGDLVKFIRLNYGDYFYIGAACYAETHPNSKAKMNDLKYLKMKVDMGVDFLITQMMFDSEMFINFYKECKEFGITVPIIPGVYIINSYESLMSMVKFCKVEIPSDITEILVSNRTNPEAIHNYGVFQCSQLIKQLFSKTGMAVIGVHFFSLNNIKLVKEVCTVLGFRNMYIERPL